MYSEEELDAAVAAGVLSAEAAAAFRAFAARNRAAPAVDEEHFRLLTGFNDIFVSIAAALILGAVGWLAAMIFAPLGGGAVAATSWGLAEYFTRRRRMALPSLLLLLSFVGGVFATVFMAIGADGVFPGKLGEAGAMAASAALAAIAAYFHWRRFKVPITVAAGVVAAIATALSVLRGYFPDAEKLLWLLLLAGGLTAFALALRWDMSDRNRTTRRADVAFWLHLSAAPLIVHPAFALLGLLPGRIFSTDHSDLGRAAAVIAIYIGLAMVALAIDRRALLVSGLSYVIYAMSSLLRAAGSLSASLALTALVIGSALLLLSAYWHPARKLTVARLPEAIRRRLPVV